jgi:hypothetical protein
MSHAVDIGPLGSECRNRPRRYRRERRQEILTVEDEIEEKRDKSITSLQERLSQLKHVACRFEVGRMVS